MPVSQRAEGYRIPKSYIDVEVNLIHIWEDSNLEYADEGFSIHELYRGLSPREGYKKERIGNLGEPLIVSEKQRNEVKIWHKAFGVFLNKLKEVREGKEQ